jgi:hypothetical protein
MKKIKLALVALVATVIITGSSVYASFPVKNEVKTEQTTNATSTATTSNTELKAVEKSLTEKVSAKPEKTQMDKEMIITLLLWFFLGGVAAHRWYKKKPVGWNILYIITLGGCGIWAIVDLINILTDNF